MIFVFLPFTLPIPLLAQRRVNRADARLSRTPAS
jgi:hypothetical protein